MSRDARTEVVVTFAVVAASVWLATAAACLVDPSAPGVRRLVWCGVNSAVLVLGLPCLFRCLSVASRADRPAPGAGDEA
ncbi:hypothetical protein ACWGB8_23255 [Kitasatospora sp. NPDC054939]